MCTSFHKLFLKHSFKFHIKVHILSHSTTQKSETISQVLNSDKIHFYDLGECLLHGKMGASFYFGEGASFAGGVFGIIVNIVFLA
jgi:hypothetical protein